MPRENRNKPRGAGLSRRQTLAMPQDILGSQDDAPLQTFIDRASGDKRRIYRETMPLDPPSPVKRARRDAQLPTASSSTESPSTSFAGVNNYIANIDADLYEIPHDGNDGWEGPPIPPRPTQPRLPPKPSDPALQRWLLNLRDVYLRLLLWHDGCGGASTELCPRCGATPDPTYRCEDCFGGRLLCEACCLEKHKEDPLHIIYEWSGGYFKKTSLKNLGQRIQFGHPPHEVCDTPYAGHRDFTVVHENGIHEVAVDFCGCEKRHRGDEPYVQLLRAGWYPATETQPQTCATFAILDRFQLEAVQAKTSAYDFYTVLEKLSDAAGVKPPDRYQVFLRMAREYRHLLMLKRAGRGHDATGIWGTAAGELAVSCPACPRPGVNLPEGWEDALPGDRALYILFLAMDACFRLKRRMVSSELKDPGLGTGWAYMVESAPYRRYLLGVTDQKEMSTCSGLAALDYANTKFSKGYSTTGVGMGVCARHEFVQANGVGDLQRGERYANMDYIFASILRHKHARQHKIVSYDIVCQWWKGLMERLKALPPLVRIHIILELFRFVIPKMHIHSHTLLCQLLFSLNLVPGSAQTDGEGIERPWAWIGGLAGSTRASGPGSRADALDSAWSYWNWIKLLGLAALLRRRLDNAKLEQVKHAEAFETFLLEQAERVPAWKAMVEEFEEDGTKKNPYEVEVKGLTEMQLRLQFAAEEEEEAAKGVPQVHEVNRSTFVAAALDLEDEQRRVRIQGEMKKAQSTAQKINMKTLRTRLTRRIHKFRKLQTTFEPAAIVVLAKRTAPEKEFAEDTPLLLPSALTEAQRAGGSGCMAGLLEIEGSMREAQCRCALVRLRNQLHIKTRFLLYKKHHARHQGMNTRARTIVVRNESKIRLHSEKYQVARQALVAIAEGDEGSVLWPRLRKSDIRCMQDAEELSRKAEKRKKALERRLRKEAELREQEELPMELEDTDEEEGILSQGLGKTSGSCPGFDHSGNVGDGCGIGRRSANRMGQSYARTRRWNEEHMRRSGGLSGQTLFRSMPGWVGGGGGNGGICRQAGTDVPDLAVRAEATRTEVKLRKGQRRRFETAVDDLMAAVEAQEGLVDEEGGDEDDEDERDDEEGDVDSEEELLLGGEVDED
ncbi:hypothetical protein B0H13DRAFT_1920967 [Mycena leptocephala]|nr:hypothetical protein B0H13DRAFT_1920967 [Mycena leptocephala]